MTITTLAPSPVAPLDNQGVPTSVDPGPDLGRKPDGAGTFWADSIYVTGLVHAGDRRFGYLVHVIRQPSLGNVVQSVSITEETDGRFRTQQEFPAPDALSWSANGLELSTPDLSWTGDDRRQHLAMTFPFGSLDLDLDVRGPVLYYAGTGTWPMLGFPQFQYALTDMRTTGSLVLDGTTYAVTGDSWLDRQWGDLPDATVMRWTWFNFALPSGDKMAVWDIRPAADDTGEQVWATVLHPDGTHELLPVTPVADHAGRVWTSPVTGQRFPTRWTISIPTRDTVLTVESVIVEQELPALAGGIYEGLASVTGTYRGAPVNAKTYVEQVGNWRV